LKLKANRHALSDGLRELNISTTQLLIKANLNNDFESTSARKFFSTY